MKKRLKLDWRWAGAWSFLLACVVCTPAAAQQPRQYWDGTDTTGNGMINGGDGPWDATTQNWTNFDAMTNSAWDNGLEANVGIFIGPAGDPPSVVTIANGYNVDLVGFDFPGFVLGGLLFEDDYIIDRTGTGSITLTNPVQFLHQAGTSTVINAPIGGTGRLEFGGGTGNLELNGAGTWTGGLYIGTESDLLSGEVEAGTLIQGSAGALPDGAPLIFSAGTLELRHDWRTTEFIGDGSTRLRIANGSTFTIDQVTDGGTLGQVNFVGSTENRLVKEGSGTFTLRNGISGNGSIHLKEGILEVFAGTYSGGTTMESGTTLRILVNNVFGTGDLTINGGTIESDDSWHIANDMVVNDDFTIIPRGTFFFGVDALELNGDMNLGGTVRTITHEGESLQMFKLGGAISNGGLTLRYNNPNPGVPDLGLVEFNGTEANTYTGITTIDSFISLALVKSANVNAVGGDLTINASATVAIVNDEQIADSAIVTLNGSGVLFVGSANGVDATTETIQSLVDDGSGEGMVQIGTEGGALIVSQGNFGGAITGGKSGTDALVKQGSGTLVLSGTNTYAGNTSIRGGALQISDNVNLGDTSAGLNFDGGTLQTTTNIHTARTVTLNAGGGTFEVDGGTALTLTSAITGNGGLGKTGAGALTLTNDNTYDGATDVENGTLILDGGSIANGTGSAYRVGINSGDDAMLTLLNGGTIEANSVTLSLDPASSGELRVLGSGSNVTINAIGMGAAVDGQGQIILAGGGELAFNSGFAQVNLGINSGSSGILKIGDANGDTGITGAGILDATEVSASNGNGRIIFDHSDDDYHFTDDGTSSGSAIDIDGNVAVSLTGTGQTTLAGSNTYTGGTVVSAGTLLVNNTAGSGTGAGEVVVEEAATIGGDGIIGGNVEIAGLLTPGNSPGTLTIDGNLTLQATAETRIELETPISFDQVMVGGLLTYGGDLLLDFSFTPTLGESFAIFDGFTGHTGAFDNISFANTGFAGTFDYDLGAITIDAIPEPSSVLLLTMAAGFGLLSRRLRKRNS